METGRQIACVVELVELTGAAVVGTSLVVCEDPSALDSCGRTRWLLDVDGLPGR